MLNTRTVAYLVIVLAVFDLLVLNLPVYADNNDFPKPLVGEDDVYSKDVNLGESNRFNWTVFKNSTRDYAVTVSVKGYEKWSQSVSPSYFVLDEDSPYRIVSLAFTIPDYPEKESRTATVTFHFRELNSTTIFIVEKQVSVNVVGITPGGEENTIVGGFRNPLPRPLNTPPGAFILNIVIWVVIAVLVYFFIKRILHVVSQKTKTEIDDIIIEIVRRPVLVLVLLYGIVYSVIKLNINISVKATLSQIYTFIVVIIGVYVSYRIFSEILEEITSKRGGASSTFGTVLKPVFKKIGLIVIIVGGLIYALSILGIEITAFLAGAGVAGLVIAFAAQDTLSNFFSGMHLLLDRPFKIGDIILLETGEYCRVVNVGMRSTKLYSIFDHQLIILPNNAVANQKIVNIVKPDTKIRNRVGVGVAYGSDLDKVTKILYEVVNSHPNVIKSERYEPLVRFTNFGDSSLDFMVIFWVDDVMNQWKVRSDIRNMIDARFREEGVTIPFPQRTVWLNQVEKPDKKEQEQQSNGTPDDKFKK
jgi:small-conductance mechanosensitive channel